MNLILAEGCRSLRFPD